MEMETDTPRDRSGSISNNCIENRTSTSPRTTLPRACRSSIPDRTKWCKGCRSHRGCDLRRRTPGRDQHQTQLRIQRGSTSPATAASGTAAAAAEGPVAHLATDEQPLPTQERTDPGREEATRSGPARRGTTCRVRLKDQRDQWCRGCKGKRRCVAGVPVVAATELLTQPLLPKKRPPIDCHPQKL